MREFFKILILVILGLLCGILIYETGVNVAWKMPEQRDTVDECRTETIKVYQPRIIGEQNTGIKGYKLPRYFVGGGAGGEGRCSVGIAARIDTVCAEMCGEVCDEESVDSVDVAVAIVQRHYGDSTYEAWVSGPIDPRLDSLRVYEREVMREVRVRDYKPPDRWGIGISAGWGMTPHGMGPYVGIGITYTIVTWKR